MKQTKEYKNKSFGRYTEFKKVYRFFFKTEFQISVT